MEYKGQDNTPNMNHNMNHNLMACGVKKSILLSCAFDSNLMHIGGGGILRDIPRYYLSADT